MKIIFYSIFLMVCVSLLSSCQKDFIGIYFAEIQNYQGVGKAYVDDSSFVCWHDGDPVQVNGEKLKVEFNTDKTVAIIKTTFTEAKAAVRAVYPASCYGGTNILKLPQEQTYRKQPDINGTPVQVIDAPMVAHTTCNVMQFYNAASLLKVNVNGGTNGVNVNRIVVSNASSENENLWGNMSYSQLDTNTAPTSSPITNNGGKTVTLIVPSGDGNVDANANASFYIVVPPVDTFQLSVNIYFEDNGAKKALRLVPKGKHSLVRNTIVNITPDMTKSVTVDWFGSGTEDDPYVVESKSDMELLSKKCSSNNNYKGMVFKQGNDIILDNNYSGVNNFAGTYDGDNDSIKLGTSESSPNNKCNGVFNTLDNGAIVKNLDVKAYISTEGIQGTGGIAGKGKGNVKIDNCSVGGIVISGGSLSSVGGIMGGSVGIYEAFEDNKVNINNCTNNAQVSGSKVGGIMGSGTNNIVSINGCMNKGNLSGDRVGGIMGYVDTYNEKAVEIYNCVNHGDISIVKHSIVINRGGGGLLGALFGSVCHIKNCYSDGGINSTSVDVRGGKLVGRVGSNGSKSGKCFVSNSYSGGTLSDQDNWIIGELRNSGTIDCKKIYCPTQKNWGPGCSATLFNKANWKVGNSLLVDKLNKNPITMPVKRVEWKQKVNDVVRLAFEPEVATAN